MHIAKCDKHAATKHTLAQSPESLRTKDFRKSSQGSLAPIIRQVSPSHGVSSGQGEGIARDLGRLLREVAP